MLGWDVTSAILLFVGLSLVYTAIGGLKAVVWTDAVQFVLFVVGGLFALFYIPTLIDGGWMAAIDTARDGGKLAWLNTEFALGGSFNIWMGIFGATIFVLFTHGIDQLVAQRVLACRSIADGRKALIFSAVTILPMMLLPVRRRNALVAVPTHADGHRDSRKRLRQKQTDYAFPIFMLTEAPVGVKGLLLVGIFAAAMSSVSSALSALASVSVMDLGFGKSAKDDDAKLKLSRKATIFWGIVLVAVAYASREVESVMNTAFALPASPAAAYSVACYWYWFSINPTVARSSSECSLHSPRCWPSNTG